MHADLDGALRAVQNISRFDWTWSNSDAQRLCDELGWRLLEASRHGAVLETNLSINKPMAHIYFDEESLTLSGGKEEAIQTMSVLVTDMSESRDGKSVRGLAGKIEQRLVAEFGTPDFFREGNSEKAVWRFSRVSVGILAMRSAIGISVMNPRYQNFLERHD